jgi:D-aspartate ligase
MNKSYNAVVLGMFETGLGVARSLGREGITVYGFDHRKDIGFYSKYLKAIICPHPLEQEEEFISFMLDFGRKCASRIVLFVTSDIFLTSVSKNRDRLTANYLINLSPDSLIQSISNKYRQFQLAREAGVNTPGTMLLEPGNPLDVTSFGLNFPVIIKALDVNVWRLKISGSVKGYTANNPAELKEKCSSLLAKEVSLVVQEIIEGPDTNHFKYCAYYAPDGSKKCEFTLRKIRQNPIHFGVGAVVESIQYDELREAGDRLFKSISFKGVGSAEFKKDEKDGVLKLIEINPRYWQQNFLTTVCGVNFPLIDYLSVTGQECPEVFTFKTGVKWVNRYLDLNSFLGYRKEGSLTFQEWRRSLKGEKCYSDFTWDDILPVFWEYFRWQRIRKIPKHFYKRFRHEAS